MAPDDAVDGAAVNIDTIFFQNRSDILLDVNVPVELDESLIGGKFIPILADAKVK